MGKEGKHKDYVGFCIDSGVLRCYTCPWNRISWVDRGAANRSTSAIWNGNSGGEKGDAAEAATASRAWRLGRRRKSCGLSHCVERYHSKFGGVRCFRECWICTTSTVFCFRIR